MRVDPAARDAAACLRVFAILSWRLPCRRSRLGSRAPRAALSSIRRTPRARRTRPAAAAGPTSNGGPTPTGLLPALRCGAGRTCRSSRRPARFWRWDRARSASERETSSSTTPAWSRTRPRTRCPPLTTGVNGFRCSDQRTTSGIAAQGRITSRAQELAGAQAVDGSGNLAGYVPCSYVAPVTGIYGVVFYGPDGAGRRSTAARPGRPDLASGIELRRHPGKLDRRLGRHGARKRLVDRRHHRQAVHDRADRVHRRQRAADQRQRRRRHARRLSLPHRHARD